MSENPSRAPIETEWGGHPRWQCPFCPRDGGDQALIVAHIDDAHPVEPEPEPEPDESAAEPLTPEEATDSPPPVETPVDEPEEGQP